jgi:lipoic acid synthetase
VEVLVPDFGGSLVALKTLFDARPDVFGHNLETVRRLSPLVQPRGDYQRSLGVLAWAKNAGLVTKSSLMLGLGETRGEVVAAMQDLRRVGCDILTLGQYLQPTWRHMPVVEYIAPAEFEWYRWVGERMGFRAVVAGPLVRSSYRAGEVVEGSSQPSAISPLSTPAAPPPLPTASPRARCRGTDPLRHSPGID